MTNKECLIIRVFLRLRSHFRSVLGDEVSVLLFLLGLLFLADGLATRALADGAGPMGTNSEAAFDPTLIKNAVGNLFQLIEGAFGALIMVVSGIGAIIAAAMGAYRASLGMLIVAVGSFILRSLVSLFFGTDFPSYEQ